MFFPSAKVIIRHPTDPKQILLVQRTIGALSYVEPAGGKIEIDFEKKMAENFETCAIREVREELGLTIEIDSYVGSYYFFWNIDPKKCSCCAVFAGNIISRDATFSANHDSCELPIQPLWINIDDIVNKVVSINPVYVGLEELITKYCRLLQQNQ